MRTLDFAKPKASLSANFLLDSDVENGCDDVVRSFFHDAAKATEEPKEQNATQCVIGNEPRKTDIGVVDDSSKQCFGDFRIGGQMVLRSDQP